MKKALSTLLVLTLIVSLFSGIGCSKKDDSTSGELTKITVVLDWTPNTNHTGMYVAQKLGYYADEGLEVEIIQPPEDGAYALIAAGKAQIAVGHQDSLAPALTADEALPITAIAAIIQHNTSGLISAKDRGISSFKDLEGKTYASWDTPLEKAVIGYCMEKEGGDVSKLTFIPSTVTNVLTALTADVDTVWVYEGWDVMDAQVEGFEYNYLDFGEVTEALDFYTPILVASDAFLKDSPDAAKAFLRATEKGYEYCMAKPEESAEILLEAAPELDADLVKASQIFLAGEYLGNEPKWGRIDPQRWAAFYDWAYENGVFTEKLSDKGFTNEYFGQ
jgi:ABC-type nitrate/sulfonate/bicarbonate transport system substrate-binding protein